LGNLGYLPGVPIEDYEDILAYGMEDEIPDIKYIEDEQALIDHAVKVTTDKLPEMIQEVLDELQGNMPNNGDDGDNADDGDDNADDGDDNGDDSDDNSDDSDDNSDDSDDNSDDSDDNSDDSDNNGDDNGNDELDEA
jgi:hypothetical protein